LVSLQIAQCVALWQTEADHTREDNAVMTLPAIVTKPPFNITRISHVVLTARSLDAARHFYVDVLGFVASDQDDRALYLRGLEEEHHSLVFVKSEGAPACRAIGFRVLTEDDLDAAKAWCDSLQVPNHWIEAPHQGRTLRLVDGSGSLIELCATMATAPRLMQSFDRFRGGSPQRLDHVQVSAANVQAACDFYARLGFRLTEYTAKDGTDELWGVWLQRKGNPHDIVFSNGRGPRLHHLAFTVPEVRDLIRACDVSASMGVADRMERGPGRHGIGNALFVYFRDPDNHRLELFNTHYQTIDLDDVPLRWELTDTRRSQLWGLPAPRRWFVEATPFDNVEVVEPLLQADPVTLETFLANQL
jgi:catechol 2,3-dioxygenase